MSALLIYDAHDPVKNREVLLAGLNNFLVHLGRHERFVARRLKAEESAQSFADVYASVRKVRDRIAEHGGSVTEAEYNVVAKALYRVNHSGTTAGLDQGETVLAQEGLGMKYTEQGAVLDLAGILRSPTLTGLAKGGVAQVGWLVRPYAKTAPTRLGGHFFLIGRHADGRWFISDQGPDPAYEREAASLPELSKVVTKDARAGTYWLYLGTLEIPKMGLASVRVLAGADIVKARAPALFAEKELVGTVYGTFKSLGSELYVVRYVATAGSLAKLPKKDLGKEYGGLSVEEAPGVHHLFFTTLLGEGDEDSRNFAAREGGPIARKRFEAVHLLLAWGEHSVVVVKVA